MTIQITIDLWQALGAAACAVATVVGAFWAVAKMAVRQIGAHLDRQDKDIAELQRKMTALEVLVATHYVRRDDHARDIAILGTKFENLAINVERKVEQLSRDGITMIHQAVKQAFKESR